MICIISLLYGTLFYAAYWVSQYVECIVAVKGVLPNQADVTDILNNGVDKIPEAFCLRNVYVYLNLVR